MECDKKVLRYYAAKKDKENESRIRYMKNVKTQL